MKIKRLIILLLSVSMFLIGGCVEEDQPQSEEEIRLQKLSFNVTELVMQVGDTFQLELNLEPENATKGRTISLYSEHDGKASVSDKFLVTAKELGETNIVAVSSLGGIEAKVKILIVPKMEAGIDFLISLRGNHDIIYLTNDVSVKQEDIELFNNERILIKKAKTIEGKNFTLDLSNITVNDINDGVIEILTDEDVIFSNITIIVPNAFKGHEDKAIKDCEGVLQKIGCNVIAG